MIDFDCVHFTLYTKKKKKREERKINHSTYYDCWQNLLRLVYTKEPELCRRVENSFFIDAAKPFYRIQRKMENVIRLIFTPILMPPNFIYFLAKIYFKSALESFVVASELLKIALKRFTCFNIDYFLGCSKKFKLATP